MEEKALNKSLKPNISMGKAACIFLLIAIIMGVLNFYAYLSGSWVPMQTIEGNQKYFDDLTPSLRNMLFVRVVMVALCIYMIWKNSKDYDLGLSIPGKIGETIGTVVLVLFAVLFSVFKLSWVDNFVNQGLMMLLFVVTDAIFIAFGVFMMRRAGAKRIFQILFPFVGNLIVNLITYGGLFAMGNTYTDISKLLSVIIFFAILSAFLATFYVVTHRLLIAITLAIIWGIAIAANAQVDIVSTSLTGYLALGLTVLLGLGAVVSIVLSFVLEKTPAEGLCEYIPAEEGFGASGASDLQSELHSSKSLLFVILSAFSAGVTFISVLLDNADEVSLNLLNFIENLINWNYREFSDPFEDLLAIFLPLAMVVVALLPLIFMLVAFVDFYLSKTQKHIDKLKKGWRWMGLAMVAYIALDIAAIVLLLTKGIAGTFAFLPPAVYESNYILNLLPTLALPEAIAYAGVAVAALLAVMHIGMLLAVVSLYKTGGSGKTRGFQFYLLLICTILMGVVHIALAFWFQGFLNPIVAVCDGLAMLLLSTILLAVYKKN